MQDMSWQAQGRRCKRYRQLSARGKTPNHGGVAIARELSAFMWAIAQAVPLIPSAKTMRSLAAVLPRVSPSIG